MLGLAGIELAFFRVASTGLCLDLWWKQLTAQGLEQLCGV